MELGRAVVTASGKGHYREWKGQQIDESFIFKSNQIKTRLRRRRIYAKMTLLGFPGHLP